MAANEYVLGLLAIVSGLAITEWIGSFYRLLAARRAVKWDWLTLLVAITAAYTIVYGWWMSWKTLGALPDVSLSLGYMSVLLIENGFLFLAARASLPEAVPDSGLDMREHYRRNSWLIWGGLAASSGLVQLTILLRNWHTLISNWQTEAFILAVVLLAVFAQRRLHLIFAPLVAAAWFAFTIGWRLGT
jgi:hypothetical protein